MRTGGNYNQIYRRYNPRAGRYYKGAGPEVKYLDIKGAIQYSDTAVGANTAGSSSLPVLELLNGCVQGTDSTTRIGRKICMKSIQGRWTFTLQTAAAGTQAAGVVAGQARLLIVYDKQANGAAPIATDILQDGTTSSLQSPLNLNNRERFIVLIDKFINLDPQGPACQTIKFYKKLPKRAQDVIFNGGNAGTIGDIQTGSVYALFVTNVQATASAALNGWSYNRIRFIDD